MRKTKQLVLASIATAASLQAQITYIDAIADSGVGTVNTTGPSVTVSDWYDANAGNANLTINDKWSRRTGTGFGNGADDVFQGRAGASNSIPELKTTITGLTEGQEYQIYAFFWDAAAGEAWNIDAGLESGNLTTFSGPDDASITMTANTGFAYDLETTGPGFTTDILTGDNDPTNTEATDGAGNRDLLYGIVGTAFANAEGQIDVFIDNSLSNNNPRRAWYDGVGYQAVPEPSAYALLTGLLSLGYLATRRRL